MPWFFEDNTGGLRGERYFVNRHHQGSALHGDRVRIQLQEAQAKAWQKHLPSRARKAVQEKRGPEAKILEVVERRKGGVVGTLRRSGKFWRVEVEDLRFPPVIALKGQPQGGQLERAPREGDQVVAVIHSFQGGRSVPRGELLRVLGRKGDPKLDILAIIHGHDLPLEFPEEVLAAAESIDESVAGEGVAEEREDWRDRVVFTIDPFDARDFDDAISVEWLPEGGWRLAVHIADVSHYVEPGSPMDREARRRGNSVYLVDRVLPMLPERLSNGICSLRPEENRLTFAAILDFDPKGRVRKARFSKAMIQSAKRFTYEEAFALLQPVLEQPAAAAKRAPEGSVEKMLYEAWALAKRLRRNRFEAGSLDLDMAEVKIVIDDQGLPTEMRRIDYDESHQLIEEFMLAANEAVAKVLKQNSRPALYRIHEDPDFDKLNEFAETARLHGHRIGDPTNKKEVNRLLEQIKGKPEEHSLKIALLKSLKRAAYSADPLGHYGLSKVDYTHFTSPIRRYADLVVHRALQAWLRKSRGQGAPRTPGYPELQEIGEHISKTERIAAEAEMDTRKIKEIEYLENLARDAESPIFEAAITEVARMGVFVELSDLLIRGLVKLEDFPKARRGYAFDPRGQAWSSRDPERVLAAGGKVRVRIARVHREKRLVDFSIVS